MKGVYWLMFRVRERNASLLKRNIIHYYSNGILYVTIEKELYMVLFKLNIIRYYSNGMLYVIIQTEYYPLLLKLNIIRYYSNCI